MVLLSEQTLNSLDVEFGQQIKPKNRETKLTQEAKEKNKKIKSEKEVIASIFLF